MGNKTYQRIASCFPVQQPHVEKEQPETANAALGRISLLNVYFTENNIKDGFFPRSRILPKKI